MRRWDVVGMRAFGDEAHVCGEEGHMCVWWRAILCRMERHYACGDEGHMGMCANEGCVRGTHRSSLLHALNWSSRNTCTAVRINPV